MFRPASSLPAGLIAILVVATSLGSSSPADAFNAPAGSKVDAQLYKPSAALVQSLLADQGMHGNIDHDGDLEVTFRAENSDLPGWIVFDRLDDGTIWNLRFTAPIPTDQIGQLDHDALMEFANSWNRDEIAVKLFLDKNGQLQAEHDLPAQHGLNPDEFRENGLQLYQNALVRILDDLSAANSGGSGGSGPSHGGQDNGGQNNGGQDNGSPGSGDGSNQPIKGTTSPDEGQSL